MILSSYFYKNAERSCMFQSHNTLLAWLHDTVISYPMLLKATGVTSFPSNISGSWNFFKLINRFSVGSTQFLSLAFCWYFLKFQLLLPRHCRLDINRHHSHSCHLWLWLPYDSWTAGKVYIFHKLLSSVFTCLSIQHSFFWCQDILCIILFRFQLAFFF